MKKIIFFFFLSSQILSATEVSSFEEARKMALATNKLIVVDFGQLGVAPVE